MAKKSTYWQSEFKEFERVMSRRSALEAADKLAELLDEQEPHGKWRETAAKAKQRILSDPKGGWAVLRNIAQAADRLNLEPLEI